jgi:dipeptide/tripeptide permease
MGERFGFYLLAALMALFLDEQWQWKQERISLTCGLFVGATYLTPLVGELLADWGLGKRRAVLLWTVVLAVGYVLLACGWLLFALAVLVVGSGLFKPSITSMVVTCMHQAMSVGTVGLRFSVWALTQARLRLLFVGSGCALAGAIPLRWY